jgi:hypothetical protein
MRVSGAAVELAMCGPKVFLGRASYAEFQPRGSLELNFVRRILEGRGASQ